MHSAQYIRKQLAELHGSVHGHVGVFVGGTSGIGEATVREFVQYSMNPRVYLLGRSQEQADRIEDEFRTLNPTSDVRFLQCDVSQLSNVDKLCEQIKTQEKSVNLLFLSAGIFHFRGREETKEGLDQKLALDCYSGLRFTENLLPLLRHASPGSGDQQGDGAIPAYARVITVLGGGNEKPVDVEDLAVERNYTVKAATNHAVTMTTLYFQRLSAAPQNSGIAFFHTSPGMVKTNGDRDLGVLMRSLVTFVSWAFRPWVSTAQESGERHLWAAASDTFGGGRLYLLGRNSELLENPKVLQRLNEEGVSTRTERQDENSGR
ncbi:hypothetical protein FSARC_6790 [Fusarium sarcochroum]|uniref:Uncharacterized protein n=1 Tax=Fusarium sarcochroum TaxID=1208366 RepID=A0A8H4TWP6_9HYPO|nr:hypothetical protein FSARC_6790 [Fusarium sarcochroum]